MREKIARTGKTSTSSPVSVRAVDVTLQETWRETSDLSAKLGEAWDVDIGPTGNCPGCHNEDVLTSRKQWRCICSYLRECRRRALHWAAELLDTDCHQQTRQKCSERKGSDIVEPPKGRQGVRHGK